MKTKVLPLSLVIITALILSACGEISINGKMYDFFPFDGVKTIEMTTASATQAPAAALPAATEHPALPAPTAQDAPMPSSTSSTAPQSYEDAAEALGVPTNVLTPLYPKPGDATVIGWKIGQSPYQGDVPYYTSTLAAGYCVDYPPSRSTLTGSTTWHVSYSPVDWNRALMSGKGTIKSQEVTIYWTQCNKGESFKDVTGSADNAGKAAGTSNACGLDAAKVADLVGGDAKYWETLANSNGEGFKYGPSAPAVTLTAPDFGRVDYPGGSLENGEAAKSVTEATFWSLGSGCP